MENIIFYSYHQTNSTGQINTGNEIICWPGWRAPGMESGGEGKGGFPWATSPLQSQRPGSAGRKLGISSVSALEISDPLGAGSRSCGSPEGVPVMKPEGGRLRRSLRGWCHLGQRSVGSGTSDLLTTCSVVTAPLLAWPSQEREERKKKKKKRGVE